MNQAPLPFPPVNRAQSNVVRLADHAPSRRLVRVPQDAPPFRASASLRPVPLIPPRPLGWWSSQVLVPLLALAGATLAGIVAVANFT